MATPLCASLLQLLGSSLWPSGTTPACGNALPACGNPRTGGA